MIDLTNVDDDILEEGLQNINSLLNALDFSITLAKENKIPLKASDNVKIVNFNDISINSVSKFSKDINSSFEVVPEKIPINTSVSLQLAMYGKSPVIDIDIFTN